MLNLNFKIVASAATLSVTLVSGAQSSTLRSFVQGTTPDSGICTTSSQSGEPVECGTNRIYGSVDGPLVQVYYQAYSSATFGDLKTKADIEITEIDLSTAEVVYGTGFVEFLDPLPSDTESIATASISDIWTITGGEDGSTGTVTLSFDLDGYSNSPNLMGGGSFFQGVASAYTEVTLRNRAVGDGDSSPISGLLETADSFQAPKNGDIDQTITLSREFSFGNPFDIALELKSVALLDLAGIDLTEINYIAGTNFSETLSLSNISVTNSFGLLDEFGLFAASEAQAFQSYGSLNSGMNVVPVPHAALLLLSGIGGLLVAGRSSVKS